MRELIIRCDHCGKVIEGNPYKICLEQVNRENEDLFAKQEQEYDEINELDWCENCTKNLAAFLLDTSHQLLVAPPVLQGSIASPKNTEETPDPDGSGGGRWVYYPKEQKLIWEN